MAGPDRVVMARIGAPHGVRGEARVKSFTGDPAALADYGPLFAADGRRFEIERLRPAKEMLVVKFAGIDRREDVERLTGTDLYVERGTLPPPEEDEFYHADLIGLDAIGAAGEPLGTVVAVHDFGAGDLLDIAPPRGPSRLVPFTKAAVPVVDLAAGRLVVILPPETDARADPDERSGP
ncbi:ribosome maturation factor RimM [Propylenella binzhouense]|uniref:Ribosome maturation factor RimM n=1 Tax=Propylenella binzhouense TaxID=2555902 RepID=A0A964T8I6_9HYPH|nr:ribosome maturation factor RimM [Propylenella binzhouense]MYZ49302.1 ribosome maturation factor RimM [Propylenella binzhouense]